MIKGFSKQTVTLSDYEKEHLLPEIVAILQEHVGIGNAITNKAIMQKLSTTGWDDAPRIRKIINHIRTAGLVPCLIASSKGYYIATDAKEITDYEVSLKGRESAIRKVRQSIKQQGIDTFGSEAIARAHEETMNELKEEEKKLKLNRQLKREVKQEKKRKRKPVLRLKQKKHNY